MTRATTQPATQITEPDLVDMIVDYVVSREPTLADRRDQITADLRAEYGGQRWYVAARPETERQWRVREIMVRFNGRNASEVARSLQISRATVYRTIKQPGLSAPQRPAIGLSSPKAPRVPAAKRGQESGEVPAGEQVDVKK
jgi:Mor family transcriptional regulator